MEADAIEAGHALGIQLRTMSERFTKLVDLMATLRAVNGCPWDRKQTHDSLKPYPPEETYEVLETIDQQESEERGREERSRKSFLPSCRERNGSQHLLFLHDSGA